MRWITLFVLLVIGLGFFVRAGVDLPYLHWVGHLPGDLVVHKGGLIFFFPFTTAFLLSLALTFLTSSAKR